MFGFSIVALSILVFSCQKQIAQNANSQKEIPNIQTVNTQENIPKDWKKIETDSFFFSIPQTLKKKNVHGIDSQVLQFENDEMTLHIEWGDYVKEFDYYAQHFENKREQSDIDGEKTVIISWDVTKPISSQMSNEMSMTNGIMSGDKRSKPKKIEKIYAIGVNFPHKDDTVLPSISFSVRSKNLVSQEIAKTIFQ